MNRVYRLLRNNIEYGPFPIDELLGQQLKPADMLWIEGRSTAWCYLTEIELKPSEKEEEPADKPEARIRSLQPSDELDKKADAIRKKVLAYHPKPLPVIEEIVSQDERHYYISTPNNETIELVDHRRQKSTMLSDVLMTGLIVALFAGGLYGGRALFGTDTRTQVQGTTVTAVSGDAHAAKAIAEPAQTDNSLMLLPDTTSGRDTLNTDGWSGFQQPAIRKPVVPETRIATEDTVDTGSTSEADMNSQETTPPVQAVKEEPKEIREPEPPVKKITESKTKETRDTIEKEEPEKKKGFFRKLFGKKNKDQDS